MSAENGSTAVFDVEVSSLQKDDVAVSNGKITGTLKYYEGWASGPLAGPGNFLALKLAAADWSAYDSVKVGLNPSMGTGFVEIKNDPDKNCVFKIADQNSQNFEVIIKKGANQTSKVYSLADLVLESDEA